MVSAAGFAVPGALAQGDGSGTNNLDLLRTGYGSQFCETAMLCSAVRENASEVVFVAPPSAEPTQPQARAATASQLQARPEPARSGPSASSSTLSDLAPRVSDSVPPFETQLSVTLRGSYANGTSGPSYEAAIVPAIEVSRTGPASTTEMGTRAGLVYADDQTIRIGEGAADFDFTQAFGPSRRFGLQAALRASQDDPEGLDLSGTGVETAPLRVSGRLDATVAQTFSRARAELSAGVFRETVSPTQLEDGTVLDNTSENITALSGGIRLSYAVTPILGAFAVADVTREDFDSISPELAASRNGWRYALSGGVTGNWSDLVTLEASIGAGRRTFDDVRLAAVDAILYGAALGFNPDPATQLRLSFDTAIAPGTGARAATLDHTLALAAAYKVNSWLGLRASARALWQEATGSNAIIRRYGAGVGADVALGANSSLALDYAYDLREDASADPQTAEAHRISAGLTLRY